MSTPYTNTSNFTYREPPIRASNLGQTYISDLKALQKQTGMDPRLTSMTANNLPVNRQQPVFQGNPSIHSQVIASRVLEPVYQIPGRINGATITNASLITQPATSQIVTSIPNTQIRNVQPVGVNVSNISRTSIPMSTIVNKVNPQIQQQNKIIQQIKIKRPVQTIVLNQQPEVLYTVKHEVINDPMVQTAHNSTYDSYYKPKQPLASRPVSSPAPEKSSCPAWLLGLLGLLALGGLIAGIILALKHNNSGGSSESISTTPGTGDTSAFQSEYGLYPNYTVTVDTTIINNTIIQNSTNNATTNSTISTNSTASTPITQFVNVTPISVAPTVRIIDPTIPAIDLANTTTVSSASNSTVVNVPTFNSTSASTISYATAPISNSTSTSLTVSSNSSNSTIVNNTNISSSQPSSTNINSTTSKSAGHHRHTLRSNTQIF